MVSFARIFDIEDFSSLRHRDGAGNGLIYVGENGLAVFAPEQASGEYASVLVELGVLDDLNFEVISVGQLDVELASGA